MPPLMKSQDSVNNPSRLIVSFFFLLFVNTQPGIPSGSPHHHWFSPRLAGKPLVKLGREKGRRTRRTLFRLSAGPATAPNPTRSCNLRLHRPTKRILAPTIVATTVTSSNPFSGMTRRSSDKTVKSEYFPISRLPFWFFSKTANAAPRVIAQRASSRVMH